MNFKLPNRSQTYTNLRLCFIRQTSLQDFYKIALLTQAPICVTREQSVACCQIQLFNLVRFLVAHITAQLVCKGKIYFYTNEFIHIDFYTFDYKRRLMTEPQSTLWTELILKKLRNFFDDILASPLLMTPEHNIQLSITRCTNIIKRNKGIKKPKQSMI